MLKRTQHKNVRFNNLLLALIICVVLLSACGSHVRHVVKKGETLYSIGWKYKQDYRMIAVWNDIPSPYFIHEGQWLRVAPPTSDKNSYNKKNKKNLSHPKNKSKKIPVKQRIADKSVAPHRKKSTSQKPLNVASSKVIRFKEEKVAYWKWPTNGRIVSKFSTLPHGNKGINIKGKRGQVIFSTAAGEVVYSGSGLVGLGKLIIIKHNKTYLSAYAHNDKILIKEGDKVSIGQKIALMGDTGSEQVLLHFEIRKNGKPVDPLIYLSR